MLGPQDRFWKPSYFDALAVVKGKAEAEGVTLVEAALRWLYHHSALRSDDGVKDRDVSADLLPQLLVYQRNELDLTVRFFTGSSLTKDLRQFMFRLAKKNHRAIADASGYGWDDDDYGQPRVIHVGKLCK